MLGFQYNICSVTGNRKIRNKNVLDKKRQAARLNITITFEIKI